MSVLESRDTRRRPRTRRSPRIRQRIQEPDEPIDLDDSTVAVHESSCIDLTSSVDDDFVDLTSGLSSQQTSEDGYGANDNSVVVLGTSHASPPPHRQIARQRFPVLDDSDDELPEVPIKIPKPSTPTSKSAAGSSTEFMSPEPIKISCPVCFDDDKTIKRNKSKLASTSCGHVFCKPCLDSAVHLQRCCPVCRKKLTSKNIFVLHL